METTNKYENGIKTLKVVVFGATGKTGRALLARFKASGYSVLAVGRNEQTLQTLGAPYWEWDYATPPDPSPILEGDIVINAVHARCTQQIASVLPAGVGRFVVMGSTRRFTRYPDQAADWVRDAESYLQSSDLPWVMVHPTMIYGASGESNVQRIAGIIGRFHMVFLPAGGRSLIQPIYTEDVIACVVAAALQPGVQGRSVVIAGPQPVSYKTFVQMIAKAMGATVMVVPLPTAIVRMAAFLTRILPGMPSIGDKEVQRLCEDKDFPIDEMVETFHVTPRSLDAGLAETFAAQKDA